MKFKFQQRRKPGMEWINQFDVFFANSANSLLKSTGFFSLLYLKDTQEFIFPSITQVI